MGARGQGAAECWGREGKKKKKEKKEKLHQAGFEPAHTNV